MKIKYLLIFAALLFPFVVVAQGVSCDCIDNLNETIKKTEVNYAGFITKVNTQTKPGYHALLKNLRTKASAQTDKKQCFYIIKQYIQFFKDKHFSFTYSNKGDFDREILAVNERAFKPSEKANDPLGIWISPDSSLTLGISKTGVEYKAIVLKAKDTSLTKGLVYFTLTPHKKGFLLKQYNVFNSTDMYAVQRGNLLQLWNFALFVRTNSSPVTTAERTELSTWKNNNNGLDFKMLDDETSYIKIPSFFNNDNKVAKLVSTNDKSIRASKYLIIDLRGNGGGSAGWSNLLPYVMTNTIQQDATLLRISTDNVKLKQAEMEYFVKNPIPADLKPYYTDDFMVQFKKTYHELPVTKNNFIPIPAIAIPMGEGLKNPVKVALITDGLCGSSAEYFFYLMKQSKKTTRYGSNSVGMMDYEGPSSITPLPCKEFILMVPVSKSSWTDTNPIDEKGFAPDVIINKPYEQWIDFVSKDIKLR
ncbi:MAG: S41 family peptidase [Bacteroidota bacterium]